MVLIETLWNVNIKKQPGAVLKSSINRNIVECKFWNVVSVNVRVPVLIETLWNVNTQDA